jgi:hypothetical protein
MTVRLPLLLSAVMLSSVGLVSSAHADPPQNGQHHGGGAAPQQHGGAPAGGAAPAANNNMAAHGNAPNNGAQGQGQPNRGGAPGGNEQHGGDNHGGPGLDVHAGVNVNLGGGPMGGRPVMRGAPVVYDDRARHEDELRLANRDAARRNAALWESQRYAREAESRRLLEARWGQEFYYRPECRYEIALDANRTARLERIIDIANDNHDLALAARARNILARENARHAREMIALRIRLGYQ